MATQRNLLDGEANLANYREMSKPHESNDALNDAILAFYKEVYELRNKYKLQDVFVIVMAGSLVDGEEQVGMSRYHAGDVANSLKMAAWAFGAEQELHESLIGRLSSPRKRKTQN